MHKKILAGSPLKFASLQFFELFNGARQAGKRSVFVITSPDRQVLGKKESRLLTNLDAPCDLSYVLSCEAFAKQEVSRKEEAASEVRACPAKL
jgi:hypothetical protein